jgi:ABC-2 type transport system permease protein
MDRELASPVWRGALNAGTVIYAALLAAAFASLSNGVAMLARQREALIGAVTFVLLPLTFLSTALMQQNLVPGWIRTVARFNPVNWAVQAGRSAAMQHINWGLVATRVGLLVALTLASATLATLAFTKYQRSL